MLSEGPQRTVSTIRWSELQLIPDSRNPLFRTWVCEITGAQDGPCVYLGGGLHGDELNGMEVVRCVAAQIAPEVFRGRVIAVPIQNPVAFHQQRRTLGGQLDDSDMNRVFPGTADGSLARRMANQLYSKSVVGCDYVIDLHSATTGDSYVPLAYLPSEGDVLEKSRELVRVFEPRVWVEIHVPGSLVSASGKDGKPGFIVELGSGGIVERKMVDVGVEGIQRLLAYLGMIRGNSGPAHQVVRVHELRSVRTSLGGFLHLHVRLGDYVEEGQELGEVIGLPNDRERLTAVCSGFVARVATRGVVAPGDRVILLAPSLG